MIILIAPDHVLDHDHIGRVPDQVLYLVLDHVPHHGHIGHLVYGHL